MSVHTRPAAAPTPPGPPASAPGSAHDGTPGWRAAVAGWPVAVRLGRREAARHPGRSTLIALMVGLPVLLLVAGISLAATAIIEPDERLPYAMGQAQARLTAFDTRITPSPWGPLPAGFHGTPDPIPGWGPTPAQQASAVRQLTGGTVIPLVETRTLARAGQRVVDVTVLGVDAAAHPVLDGLVRLRSGRWPTGPGEVVVTPTGQHRGLPESGDILVVDPRDGTESTRRVVGVADAFQASWDVQAVELIGWPGALGSTGAPAFVLERSEPVRWAEVQRLAAYGLHAHSRSVVLDPPPADQLPDQGWGSGIDDAQLLMTALVSIVLLLETTLLVGPAFAVTAAAQRRTLALAAGNGATLTQLRRVVLGPALVLGVVAVLVGAGLGVGTGYAVLRALRANDPAVLLGPFGVLPGPLLVVLATAVASTLVAALLPARGLARLDLVAALRGQVSAPPLNWRSPVGALVLGGLGALVVVAAAATPPNATISGWPAAVLTGLGAIALVAGALSLAPALLVWLARAGRAAPAPWRMALRDAARHRGRATATIGAMLGAAALSATVLVAVTSAAVVGERDHRPIAPLGVGVLSPSRALAGQGPAQQGPGEQARAVITLQQLVATAAPRLRTGAIYAIGRPSRGPVVGPPPDDVVASAIRRGCAAAEALAAGPADPRTGPSDRCLSVSTSGLGDFGGITIGDLDILVATYRLDTAQADTLRAGGALVNGDPPTPTRSMVSYGDPTAAPEPLRCCQVDILESSVSIATGVRSFAEQQQISGVQVHRLPARPVPAEVLRQGSPSRRAGILVTTTTAQALGWPLRLLEVLVADPTGAALSSADEQAVHEVVTAGAVGRLEVERGYQAYDRVVGLVALGVLTLIALVATLISTALSVAQAKPFHATLAAVGATRATIRRMAGSQAVLVSVLGTLLGLGIGIVFGAAAVRAEYSGRFDLDAPVTVVVPWAQLAVPVVLIPLLAGALAWSVVRRAPQPTRRRTDQPRPCRPDRANPTTTTAAELHTPDRGMRWHRRRPRPPRRRDPRPTARRSGPSPWWAGAPSGSAGGASRCGWPAGTSAGTSGAVCSSSSWWPCRCCCWWPAMCSSPPSN